MAQRVDRGIALLCHDRALEGGEWSAVGPGRILTPRKTRYPLYRRLGGPQGRYGRAENLARPGFDPRTVQPVASRYTDLATRHTVLYISISNVFGQQRVETKDILGKTVGGIP